LFIVQLVGPAEVVDDFCYGLSGFGVANIMSQLELLYYRYDDNQVRLDHARYDRGTQTIGQAA
jgi:hypothetical protein